MGAKTTEELAALRRRLEAWGENDPNPDWFKGDVLGAVLADCADAARAMLAMELNISRLRGLARSAALKGEPPRTAIRQRLTEAEATIVRMKAEAEQMQSLLVQTFIAAQDAVAEARASALPTTPSNKD